MQDDIYSLLHIGSSAIHLGRLQSADSPRLPTVYSGERPSMPSECSEMYLQALSEPLYVPSVSSITYPGAQNRHSSASTVHPEATYMHPNASSMHTDVPANHPGALTTHPGALTMHPGALTMYPGFSTMRPETMNMHHDTSIMCTDAFTKNSGAMTLPAGALDLHTVHPEFIRIPSGAVSVSPTMHPGSKSIQPGASSLHSVDLIQEMQHKSSGVIIENADVSQTGSSFFQPGGRLFKGSKVHSEGSYTMASILTETPASRIRNDVMHQPSTKNHELSEIFPIEKFSNLPHYVLKKDCTLNPSCSLLWSIELMIQKNTRRVNCFELKVKLIRNGTENGTLRTNLRIALTDSNSQVLYDSVFSSLSSSEYLPSTSWFTMLLHEKNMYPLLDDKLNVCLVLKVKDCCLNKSDIPEIIENDDDSFTKMLLSFQNDLRTAYDSKLLNDFCLVVGAETYEVNKFVLCARSPVFSNLFGLGTQPCTFYRLDPACKTKQVMDAFLLYLYTGIIDDLDMDTTCGLYVAAKEFHVMALSPACGNTILSKMTSENACKVLILVHRNRDVFLKDAALRFIKKHVTEVELTRDWLFLSRNLPVLKSEIQTFFETS